MTLPRLPAAPAEAPAAPVEAPAASPGSGLRLTADARPEIRINQPTPVTWSLFSGQTGHCLVKAPPSIDPTMLICLPTKYRASPPAGTAPSVEYYVRSRGFPYYFKNITLLPV